MGTGSLALGWRKKEQTSHDICSPSPGKAKAGRSYVEGQPGLPKGGGEKERRGEMGKI